MKKIQQGFTLIELMIVVAIIGILAAVALPAYQDYISKAQVSEANSLLGGFPTDMNLYYGEQTGFPADMAAFTAYTGPKTVSGKYVGSITLESSTSTGVIARATMKASGVGAAIASKTIDFSFWSDANNIVHHVCKAGASDPVPTKFLPGSCK